MIDLLIKYQQRKSDRWWIFSFKVIIKVLIIILILILIPTVISVATLNHILTEINSFIVFKTLVTWFHYILRKLLLHVLFVSLQLIISHLVQISVLIIKFFKILHFIVTPTIIIIQFPSLICFNYRLCITF